MVYFAQIPDESQMSIEIRELLEEIKGNTFDTVKLTTSTYFTNMDEEYVQQNPWLKQAIPVGSLEFVQSFLKAVHNIGAMNPIEIPTCLRVPHILLREYRIVRYEDLPHQGRYFIKDVSGLKCGTYCGEIEEWLANPNKYKVNKAHIYQVSEELDIYAEYRVFIMNNKVYGIQFYDGSPLIMPTPNEINKIKEMALRYSAAKDCPGAYTMDVAIIDSDNEKGRDLTLLEIHPFVSVGTYGCRGSFLPAMYRLGIEWYVKHNTKLKIDFKD